jgi:hypothetical protein
MKSVLVLLVSLASTVLSFDASAGTICLGPCQPAIDIPPITLNPTPPLKSHTMGLSYAEVQGISVIYDSSTDTFTSYTNWLYHIDIYPANPSGNYQAKASVIDLPIFTDAFITNLTISSGWQPLNASPSQSSMSFVNNNSSTYNEFQLTFNSSVAPSFRMPLTISYLDNTTETIQAALPLTPLAISAGYLPDIIQGPAIIPEPESYAMLIIGLATISFFVRRAKS